VKGNSKKMKVVKGTESYEDLYKLGRDMFNLYQKDKVVFTMPKNKSRTIECIVLEITNRRVRVNKGDIHKVMTESNKIFIDELTKKQSSIYILEQKDILRWVLGKWSTHSFENQVKVVDNDRLRVFGLMFSESMREYIPNLIGGNRLSFTRAQLDEQPSLSRGLWRTLLLQFNDPKVVVPHPEKWDTIETISKVGEKTHKSYNPNDPGRIKISRHLDSLRHMVKSTMTQYNKVMNTYTLGTGGGSGHPANFANWMDRDPLFFDDYDTNKKSHYLTYIHMYNHQYDHPMVKINERLPCDAAIQDTSSNPSSTQKGTGSASAKTVLNTLDSLRRSIESKAEERTTIMKNLMGDLTHEKKVVEDPITLISKVTEDLTKATNIDLERAKIELLTQISNFMPKIKLMTEEMKSAQSEMDVAEENDDVKNWKKAKKRKRNYEKNRESLEKEQGELRKKLKLVSKGCCNDRVIDSSSGTESDVSVGNFKGLSKK
jgi:hypothetical protein